MAGKIVIASHLFYFGVDLLDFYLFEYLEEILPEIHSLVILFFDMARISAHFFFSILSTIMFRILFKLMD